jgi:hypothetical protein
MKPGKKKRQGSLLTRFFKKSSEKTKEPRSAPKKVNKGRAVPVKDTAPKDTAQSATPSPNPASIPAKPATPAVPSALAYSIAEIKQLMAIGKKDPQRLALLVGNMLEAEKERQLAERQSLRPAAPRDCRSATRSAGLDAVFQHVINAFEVG